jgi:molybdopterin synthase sulfur carrier subunit
MRVAIPSVLQAYTDGVANVEAAGTTVAELLDDLDRRYPGIRFRMVTEAGTLRPHVRVFVNRELERDLGRAIAPTDEVVILQALSGG